VGLCVLVLKCRKGGLGVIGERIDMDGMESKDKNLLSSEEFLNSKKKGKNSVSRRKNELKDISEKGVPGEKSEMGMRYEAAYKKLFDNFPKWKQIAIKESLELKRQDDDLLNYFIKDVIILAEKDLTEHLK
jgi:hypothetical protein